MGVRARLNLLEERLREEAERERWALYIYRYTDTDVYGYIYTDTERDIFLSKNLTQINFRIYL